MEPVQKTLLTTNVLRRVDAAVNVRMKREQADQDIGFGARPFILCSLPIRRLPDGINEYERRNGKVTLKIIGDSRYGIPYGADRLIPIWVATMAIKQKSSVLRFEHASEVLDTFGLQTDGKHYHRLMSAFQRIFTSTFIIDISDHERQLQMKRFNFFQEINLWFTRSDKQRTLENTVVLSGEFWQELQEHPIPVDLAVIRELANNAGALDLYTWLAWRCWKTPKTGWIPLFGENGLNQQFGVGEYSRDRKFRERMKEWLHLVRLFWPECPVTLSADNNYLVIDSATAIQVRKAVEA